MLLPVVKYGHPTLRQKGAHVDALTPHVRQLIVDMFETMYDSSGVGLAAQQVGEALQLCVLDAREAPDRPSTLMIHGKSVDPQSLMPLVLINPELTPSGPFCSGPEGCLSFPEIYADIERPDCIHVTAMNEKWERLEFDCCGFLSRAIQHEVDHLNGILFIDRMGRKTKIELQPDLEMLHTDTKASLARAHAH
jgi:peptide deformylase